VLCLALVFAANQRANAAEDWTTDATSPTFPIAGNALEFMELSVRGALEIVAVFPPNQAGVVSFIARTEGSTLAFPYGAIDVLDSDGMVIASAPYGEIVPPLLPSGGIAIGSADFGDTDLTGASSYIISITAGDREDSPTWRGLHLAQVESDDAGRAFTMRNRTSQRLENLVMYVACFGDDGTPLNLVTMDNLPDSVAARRSFRVFLEGSCPRFVVYAAGSE
jgi:hypothetical protein